MQWRVILYQHLSTCDDSRVTCNRQLWESVTNGSKQGVRCDINCNVFAPKLHLQPLIARFMGPTWGPSAADRTQVDPMLAQWTLLSGTTLGMSKIGQVMRKICDWREVPRHGFKTSSYIWSFTPVEYLLICNGIHHANILSWISVCNGTHSIAKSFRWHMKCNYGRMFTSMRNKYSTYWGRLTHICVNNQLNTIGSGNGSPSRRQAIIWYIVNLTLTFSFKKMHFKTSSVKWW